MESDKLDCGHSAGMGWEDRSIAGDAQDRCAMCDCEAMANAGVRKSRQIDALEAEVRRLQGVDAEVERCRVALRYINRRGYMGAASVAGAFLYQDRMPPDLHTYVPLAPKETPDGE